MAIGIGIDTGGTYTDAVIYDFETKQVLANGKSRTTKENLEIGIINAMDALPGELLRQAKILSLSTTLATNACVEDKGGRAKLILLGTSDKVMSWVNARTRYGLRSEDVLCIDTSSIYRGEATADSDWFREMMQQEEFLQEAQALAVAEVFGMQNGAVCERFAKQQLTKKYPVPFVMANELAAGLNIMERGATALLNARLLPIIEEFLKAVSSALEKRGLNVTEMIVRSDGSLMSQPIALTYPVQTILSGPASSVIGARNLAQSENCLIVDMGGTTTDISVIKNDIPEMSDRITIGGYKTQIKGVYIDTFGLGGDSRIAIVNDQLTLDTRRVQPLCVAAAEHPELVFQLQALVDSQRTHTKPLHEVLYLVREPADPSGYTKTELEIISQLRDHPVMLGSGELDIYNLKTERLETEGLIMRCGLTPTDIMHIRGDFDKFDRKASVLGARYLMRNLKDHRELDAFCEEIYDMVCRKLYENIIKILFINTYPDVFGDGLPEELMQLIRRSWKEEDKRSFFGFNYYTKAALIGIGAPTHIFLPRVAQVLNTKCIIPPHAEVANAVGAITADISARRDIVITPNYNAENDDNYTVFGQKGERSFAFLEDAVAFAKEEAGRLALEDARKRGAVGELTTDVRVHSKGAEDKSGALIELDTTVTAYARGKVYQ